MESKYLDRYMDYLRDVRKYSIHTLTSYSNDIGQFDIYINDYEEELKQASHIHVRSWIVTLMEKGISAKSINRKISSLRSFYNFLKRNGEITTNPMLKIIAPKIPKRLPKYVDEAKIHKILDDKTLTEPDYRSAREHIVISLLYHTGMRRAELLSLNLSDLDLVAGTVKVLGKGNKERIIPLNNKICEELTEYMVLRNESFAGPPLNLILTDSGKAAYPKLIYNIVSRVLKKYNASEKSSPHILRHTFATHLTSNGAELNAVKELLGHASLAATQVYTHNSIERLKAVYDKAHPKSKSS